MYKEGIRWTECMETFGRTDITYMVSFTIILFVFIFCNHAKYPQCSMVINRFEIYENDTVHSIGPAAASRERDGGRCAARAHPARRHTAVVGCRCACGLIRISSWGGLCKCGTISF